MSEKSNMYSDSKMQWNVFKGCEFQCVYCIPSFQRQAKRQKHRCMDCYNYTPHFHPERLNQQLPLTKGDEFIWACSSGDISFAKEEDLNRVLDVMRLGKNQKRTFFMQSKDPFCFNKYDLPKNLIIGTTIESNRAYDISKAPSPWIRKQAIESIEHPRKRITIEPIMDFDLDILFKWMDNILPEIIYIGYDTKKCKLSEPTLNKTKELIFELEQITRVKPKLLRKAWSE